MRQTMPLEVGIPVVDLDRMYAFYTQVLSCTEARRADIPSTLSRSLGVAPDGYINIWLKTPNNEVIKLVRPPVPPTIPPAPEWMSRRTGIAYLTFYCSDLDATLAAAEAAGAVLKSERALIGKDRDLRLCFFADPEDNIIELVEVKQ
ncbi:VOC family protein [Emcibacter sp. SYSU 3D8]|uniref:VOC family protein n=1 Tax=Emcibacter sp. SYSU 3D8 TaxID=3133969 RepID=UPI0031FE51A6